MHNHSDIYQRGMSRALDTLITALNNNSTPSLDELAAAACMSKYHFHRVFRLLTGETCQQMMTRLKLAKATGELGNENNSITDIALNAGFSSSQDFAKALKREVNSNATQLHPVCFTIWMTLNR